ncbi:MAG: DUF488 family protein [Deltaproteobacteria bacterium]|jgi:uncharacterized protein YeaO (DUF488 family)|nr:DUF488 family protein [Syntrophaceae bacterium]
MAIRIVRLGTDRAPGEGIRIGTVRRPPRGVPKTAYASKNFYDVWLPNLAPSEALVKSAQGARTQKEWNAFLRKYRAEMMRPENRHILEVLAALSHSGNFSVGCYCADEARCHRSVLRKLLAEHGAKMAGPE